MKNFCSLRLLLFLLAGVLFISLSSELLAQTNPHQRNQSYYLFLTVSENGQYGVFPYHLLIEGESITNQNLSQNVIDQLAVQKKPLKVYSKGKEVSQIFLTGKRFDYYGFGTGEKEEVYAIDGHPKAYALASNLDLNPGGRFTSRSPDSSMKENIIQTIAAYLSKSTQPGASAMRSEIQKKGGGKEKVFEISVIEDQQKMQKHAVVTLEKTDSKNHKSTMLAILFSDASTPWQVLDLKTEREKSGSEAEPTSWRLLNFGDLKRNSGLTIFLNHFAYESSDFSCVELSGKKVLWP